MVLVLMRQICTCLSSGFAALLLLAQFSGRTFAGTGDEGVVRVWRSSDGLPSDSVMAVLQTRNGYLWIGTSGGLVRFDGVKFTSIPLTEAGSNTTTAITALCEDRDGGVWIGTQQNGLYQLHDGTLVRYSRQNGLLDDAVTCLAADPQGFVWIGTKSGLNLATGRDFRALTTKEGLPDDFISGVHVARSGTVWITTRSGMIRFVNGRLSPYSLQTDSQGRSPEYLGVYEDHQGNLWAFGDTYLINLAEGKRFNYFRGTEAASVRIWSLCEGRDGRLWIGTSGRGLFCFGENHFQPVLLGELRGPYDVRGICEDREGNLWLGTSGGGLLQLRPQPIRRLHVGLGAPTDLPTALALDGGERVLVGLQHGGVFVNAGDRFEPLPGTASEIPDYVTCLSAGRNGAVWVGTLGNGLYAVSGGQTVHFTTTDGLGDDSVLAVGINDRGVWVSTGAGTLHCYQSNGFVNIQLPEALQGVSITTLLAVEDRLWLGAENGTLLREENGKFTVAQVPEKVSNHAVIALCAGAANRIWMGTAHGGLACFRDGVSRVWTKENGLPDDFISGVTEDAAENLWLVTGKGIYRVTPEAVMAATSGNAPLDCRLMAGTKVWPDAPVLCGGLRALTSSGGRLWFTSSEGALTVDAGRPEGEEAALPVYVESLGYNSTVHLPSPQASGGVAPQAPTTLELPGRPGPLEIQFTALHFSAPEQVRFRHKLEGYDPGWVEGGERSVRYGRLPYGSYRFQLAARVANGPWHEMPTPIAFQIPTPLYLRSWAILLYGFAAVALIAALARIVSHRRLRLALARLEQQQSLERERMRIARDMHDEMGSKLTKISFLSEHAKMEAALSSPLAGRIESIAETSRDLLKTMDEIVWVVNPRNDTLEHLAAYLSHHASEYFQNTNVECELKLPREMPHRPLVSEVRHNLFLAFEEALNNVLKHSGASRVRIEMVVNPQGFEIVISDNGSGFEMAAEVPAATPPPREPGARSGLGLRNMRQRMADLGGECVIQSKPGGGTQVVLKLRFRPDENRKA